MSRPPQDMDALARCEAGSLAGVTYAVLALAEAMRDLVATDHRDLLVAGDVVETTARVDAALREQLQLSPAEAQRLIRLAGQLDEPEVRS